MSESISSGNSVNVHIGFWTNWSQGSIKGATITLSRSNGGLLIAFLAIFVGVVGRSFWRIVCFGIHHAQSSATPQDGLYHQRQAILRNSTTSTDGLEMFMRILWVWRRRAPNSIRRLLPVATVAAVIAGLFAVASLFSSHVTTASRNEVLVNTDQCIEMAPGPNTTYAQYLTAFNPYQAKRIRSYANHVSQCYRFGVTSEDCHLYALDQLAAKITTNASCPFASEMCLSGTENIIIDSGSLNSLTDFGINTPSKEQFELRFVQHCAPLVTKGFKKIHVPPNMTEEFGVMQYLYGPTAVDGQSIEPSTYQTPINSSFQLLGDNTTTASWPIPEHRVTVFAAHAAPAFKNSSGFIPIPQLQRTDADVILIFRSSPDVIFVNQSDDPFFPAHTHGNKYYEQEDPMMSVGVDTFSQDEPASVLGCTVQQQFCNPDLPESSRCEPLRAPLDHSLFNQIYPPGDGSVAGIASILFESTYVTMAEAIRTLKNSALIASDSLSSSVQGPIPSNQWQQEVQYWFNITMASMQGLFLEAASPPTDPELDPFRIGNEKPNDIRPCNLLKIHSSSYPSFSVLGISIIFVIGSIIIVIDWTLSHIVDSIQTRYKKDSYSRLEWCSNDTLQLQRLAHEELGLGRWSRTDEGIPVTEKGETLAVIDVSNEKHPTLRNPQVHRSNVVFSTKENGSQDGSLPTPVSPVSPSTTFAETVSRETLQREERPRVSMGGRVDVRSHRQELSPVSPSNTLHQAETLVEPFGITYPPNQSGR